MGKETRAGFTILELMIVVAVTIPVLGVIFSGMGSVARTSTRAASVVEAQQHLIQATTRIEKELRVAQITAVAPDGLSITYQHPVDVDGLGAVDGLGTISWGALEAAPAGPVLGNTYTLRFVQDNTLQEPALGLDLNGDGDTVDSYRLGHLQRTTSGGGLADFTPSVFMVNLVDPTSDLNGDGQPDPMFSWAALQPVTIHLLARIRDLGVVRQQSQFSMRSIHLPNMDGPND